MELPFPLSEEIHVYTDRSHDQANSVSSWSTVVGNRWFYDKFLPLSSGQERVMMTHDSHQQQQPMQQRALLICH